MSSITVVIVTFNRKSSLCSCLKSLSFQTILPEKVVIIDNAGNLCLDLFSNLPHINIQLISGFYNSLTTARNIGVTHSETEYTLLLDDDVTIPPDYCESMLNLMKILPCDFAGGQFVMAPSEFNKFANVLRRCLKLFNRSINKASVYRSIQASYPSTLGTDFIESDWLSGTNLFYRTDILRQVTWDDKLVKYCEGEDIDHSLRVRRSGYRLFISGLSHVNHLADSSGRMPTEQFYLMHEHYTLYLYFKLFADNPLPYILSRIGNLLFDFYYDLKSLHLSLPRCRCRLKALSSTFYYSKKLASGNLKSFNYLY